MSPDVFGFSGRAMVDQSENELGRSCRKCGDDQQEQHIRANLAFAAGQQHFGKNKYKLCSIYFGVTGLTDGLTRLGDEDKGALRNCAVGHAGWLGCIVGGGQHAVLSRNFRLRDRCLACHNAL